MTSTATKIREIEAFIRALALRGQPPAPHELVWLDTLLHPLEKLDSPAAKGLRGCFFALQGEKDAAAQWHEAAIAEQPENPDEYVRHAESLARMNDQDKATARYAEALQKNFDSPEQRAGILNAFIFTALCAGKVELLREKVEEYAVLTGEEHGVVELLRSGDVVVRNGAAAQCYAAACASGAFKDWEHPDEDEAWKHLQWAT